MFVVPIRNSVSSAAMSFTIAPVGAADGRASADVGVEAAFGVQARDAFGNLQDMSEASGNYFSVNVTDAAGSWVIAYSNLTIAAVTARAAADFEPPVAEILDLDSGQYAVSYTVYKSGAATVGVAFNGEPIGTADDVADTATPPHAVDVRPGAIRAAMSLAVGNGTSSVVAGEPAEFEIIFRDEYGNDVQDQGSSSVFGAQSARHTLITACEDGAYPCDVSTREYTNMSILEVRDQQHRPGPLRRRARGQDLEGVAIDGSLYRRWAAAGAVSRPWCCEVFFPSSTRSALGEDARKLR